MPLLKRKRFRHHTWVVAGVRVNMLGSAQHNVPSGPRAIAPTTVIVLCASWHLVYVLQYPVDGRVIAIQSWIAAKRSRLTSVIPGDIQETICESSRLPITAWFRHVVGARAYP